MRFYKVIISLNALSSIDSYYNYLSNVVDDRSSVDEWLIRLRQAMLELDYMPYRHQFVDREPWKRQGVRQKVFEKYSIYYCVSEYDGMVIIIDVISSSKARE